MTPNEVSEANRLITTVSDLKRRISQIETVTATAVRTEIIFSPKPKAFSKVTVEVTGEKTVDLVNLILKDLRERIDSQIRRLVELGVEAP